MSVPNLDHLRQWVGRERVQHDELPLFPARALAAALDRKLSPDTGDALPPFWQWLYFLETPRATETGVDGHARLDANSFLPPSPLPRRMWASGALQIERSLRLGQPATRTTRIASVDSKSGRSGLLLFVNLDHTFHQDGELCIREEQNLVYREMPTAAAELPPGEPALQTADWSQTITPDPVLLFRYSALTFNGHRIHYDRNFAVEREFYPALVVHGPLLATLLLEQIAQRLPGAGVKHFPYRALRPTFDTQPFTVNARHEKDHLQLWTADQNGFLCMTAEASLA